jgi:hypothetical protein
MFFINLHQNIICSFSISAAHSNQEGRSMTVEQAVSMECVVIEKAGQNVTTFES